MAQNGTDREPTARQKKVAEMLINPEFQGSITDLCNEANVPRRTFYNWRDDPVFCNYLDGLIDKYTDSELAGVWKALIKQCLSGNVQAIRLFFELKGKFSQQQSKEETSELYKVLERAWK
jgi:hypothetical protein